MFKLVGRLALAPPYAPSLINLGRNTYPNMLNISLPLYTKTVVDQCPTVWYNPDYLIPSNPRAWLSASDLRWAAHPMVLHHAKRL